MIQKQHTYIVTCDRCGKDETLIISSYQAKLPPGWGYVRTYGHGLTDYSKAEERCSKCKELP
jgi:hypothetical protein